MSMRARLVPILLCLLGLASCGGGDPEPPSQMPCKYRPDCTVGPPTALSPAAKAPSGAFFVVWRSAGSPLFGV